MTAAFSLTLHPLTKKEGLSYLLLTHQHEQLHSTSVWLLPHPSIKTVSPACHPNIIINFLFVLSNGFLHGHPLKVQILFYVDKLEYSEMTSHFFPVPHLKDYVISRCFTIINSSMSKILFIIFHIK